MGNIYSSAKGSLSLQKDDKETLTFDRKTSPIKKEVDHDDVDDDDPVHIGKDEDEEEKKDTDSNARVELVVGPLLTLTGGGGVTPESTHIMSIIDPRSPNVLITRTPIVLSDDGGIDKKKKNPSDGQTYRIPNENSSIELDTSPDWLPGISRAFDPRSPAHEFNRTPILLDTQFSGANGGVVPSPNFVGQGQDDAVDGLEKRPMNYKRPFDSDAATDKLCTDLRRRMFISKKLNLSDEVIDDSDKENEN